MPEYPRIQHLTIEEISIYQQAIDELKNFYTDIIYVFLDTPNVNIFGDFVLHLHRLFQNGPPKTIDAMVTVESLEKLMESLSYYNIIYNVVEDFKDFDTDVATVKYKLSYYDGGDDYSIICKFTIYDCEILPLESPYPLDFLSDSLILSGCLDKIYISEKCRKFNYSSIVNDMRGLILTPLRDLQYINNERRNAVADLGFEFRD